MIEELREKFPEEVVWNILKYTRHPIALIMHYVIDAFENNIDISENRDEVKDLFSRVKRHPFLLFIDHQVISMRYNCDIANRRCCLSKYWFDGYTGNPISMSLQICNKNLKACYKCMEYRNYCMQNRNIHDLQYDIFADSD